jgi:hypothetical protein
MSERQFLHWTKFLQFNYTQDYLQKLSVATMRNLVAFTAFFKMIDPMAVASCGEVLQNQLYESVFSRFTRTGDPAVTGGQRPGGISRPVRRQCRQYQALDSPLSNDRLGCPQSPSALEAHDWPPAARSTLRPGDTGGISHLGAARRSLAVDAWRARESEYYVARAPGDRLAAQKNRWARWSAMSQHGRRFASCSPR